MQIWDYFLFPLMKTIIFRACPLDLQESLLCFLWRDCSVGLLPLAGLRGKPGPTHLTQCHRWASAPHFLLPTLADFRLFSVLVLTCEVILKGPFPTSEITACILFCDPKHFLLPLHRSFFSESCLNDFLYVEKAIFYLFCFQISIHFE